MFCDCSPSESVTGCRVSSRKCGCELLRLRPSSWRIQRLASISIGGQTNRRTTRTWKSASRVQCLSGFLKRLVNSSRGRQPEHQRGKPVHVRRIVGWLFDLRATRAAGNGLSERSFAHMIVDGLTALATALTGIRTITDIAATVTNAHRSRHGRSKTLTISCRPSNSACTRRRRQHRAPLVMRRHHSYPGYDTLSPV